MKNTLTIQQVADLFKLLGGNLDVIKALDEIALMDEEKIKNIFNNFQASISEHENHSSIENVIAFPNTYNHINYKNNLSVLWAIYTIQNQEAKQLSLGL